LEIRRYKSKYNVLSALLRSTEIINYYKGSVLPSGWISSGALHSLSVGGSCADRRIRELRQIKGIDIEMKIIKDGLPNATYCYKLTKGITEACDVLSKC